MFDCVVVGGGPAGLSAAIYLARFRRSVALIDAGKSRAELIPRSHNHPGYAQGVEGAALLESMRAQARRFDVSIIQDEVLALHPLQEDRFVVHTAQPIEAGYVILATGMVDRVPPVSDALNRVREGLLRQCPVCDAFELTGQRIAVVGDGSCAAGEALFLSHYTDDVTILTLGKPLDVTEEVAQKLNRAGVKIVSGEVDEWDFDGEAVRVRLTGRAPLCFAAIYSGLGSCPRNVLASSLGIKMDDDGRILTDGHQQTSFARVFAAGDVVTGLNQLAVAMAQGEIAATRIHNHLRLLERRCLADRL